MPLKVDSSAKNTILRLREARFEARMTQQQLANKLHLIDGATYVSRAERGLIKPSPEYIEKVLMACGFSADWQPAFQSNRKKVHFGTAKKKQKSSWIKRIFGFYAILIYWIISHIDLKDPSLFS